ncbi:hypothetical protein ACG7TL_005289 [Trametes sanguinea]
MVSKITGGSKQQRPPPLRSGDDDETLNKHHTKAARFERRWVVVKRDVSTESARSCRSKCPQAQKTDGEAAESSGEMAEVDDRKPENDGGIVRK